MDKQQFKEAVIAALIGSGRIRRESFNTYDVGRLVDLAPEVADKGWQFQLLDGNSSYLALLIYASLLGSKGCISSIEERQYGLFWDEAHRLERIVIATLPKEK